MAAEIDAERRGMAWAINCLWAHDLDKEEYTHGETPKSRCADEQASLVLGLAVDRFADLCTGHDELGP